MTIKNARMNVEEAFRSNRSIKPLKLGDAALKKLALPRELFGYKQCLRLKKSLTKIVDGDIGSQFACLVSRLEFVKLHDTQTRINLRLSPINLTCNGETTFAYRFRGYSVVPGTSVRLRSSEGKTLITAMDAAHLTNRLTRGVMLASVVQGADREI